MTEVAAAADEARDEDVTEMRDVEMVSAPPLLPPPMEGDKAGEDVDMDAGDKDHDDKKNRKDEDGDEHEGDDDEETEEDYNPDRQAAVREFMDFTEYLPSDIARSLSILRRMDETFENAKKKLEEHTLAVANVAKTSSSSSTSIKSNTSHTNNPSQQMSNGICAPTPDSPALPAGKILVPCDRAMMLRLSIAQSLKRCRMARMQSRVESERLSLNINRHLSRASHIVDKIKQIDIPEDLPEPETPANKSPRKKVVLRIGNTMTTPRGSPQKKRPTIRLSTGGRNRDDSDHMEGIETPGGDHDKKKKRKASNVGPRQPPPPIPTLANGDPLPDSEKPWNQLMPHELARLRKRMKKNAAWTPSATMIHRELELLGRGVKNKDAYKHQWLGKEVEFIPAEEGGIGYAAIAAVKEPETIKVMNKGHILAQAKKRKKERERLEAEMKAKEAEITEKESEKKKSSGSNSSNKRVIIDDDDIEMKDADAIVPPPIVPDEEVIDLTSATTSPTKTANRPAIKRRKSSTNKVPTLKLLPPKDMGEVAIESDAEAERDAEGAEETSRQHKMDLDPPASTTAATYREPPSPILPDISVEDIRREKSSEVKSPDGEKKSPDSKDKKKSGEQAKKKAPTDRDRKTPDVAKEKKATEKKKAVGEDSKGKKKSPEVKDKKKTADDKEKKDENRPVFPPILPEFPDAPPKEPILPPTDDEIKASSSKPSLSLSTLKSPSKEKSAPSFKTEPKSSITPKTATAPKLSSPSKSKKKEPPAQTEKAKEAKSKETKEKHGKTIDDNTPSLPPPVTEKSTPPPAPAEKPTPTPTSEKEPESEEAEDVTTRSLSETEQTPDSDTQHGPSTQLQMETEKQEALQEPIQQVTKETLEAVPEEPMAETSIPSPESELSLDDEELTPPPEMEPDDVQLAIAAESKTPAKAKAKPRKKAAPKSKRAKARAAAAKKADAGNAEEAGEEDEEIEEETVEEAPAEPVKEPSPPPIIPPEFLPRRTSARAAAAAKPTTTEPPPSRAGQKRKREPTPKEPTPPPPPAPVIHKKPKRKGPRWTKKRRSTKSAEPSTAATEAEAEAAEEELIGLEEEEVIDDNEERFCLCRGVSRGTMVCCDNPGCAKEWFHLDCVGLKVPPKAHVKWYCPECIVLRDEGGRKRRKR